MLCQFSFKNFKSYRDETIFDLQAAPLLEFRDTLLVMEKAEDILPVSVIYGPNGGGKSNALQALACLIDTVVNPIHSLEKNRVKGIFQHNINPEPFLFDKDSKNEPTEFLIYFRTGDNEYRYYLSIHEDIIISESLDRKKIGAKRSAHLFERENGKISLGSSIKKKKINIEVNPKMPYLSFLAINYDMADIVEVQIFFESCIVRNFANFKAEMQMVFFENESQQNSLLIRCLNDMGIDIDGYKLDSENNQLYTQRFLGEETYDLPYYEESDGTKKLLVALPLILIALKEGRLVIVDELDAKLHPKLIRHIITMFKNPVLNKKGAQLVFTSHDMSTLKNTVFRRDEIWFAALNEDHSSVLYSLYDIRKPDNERINNTAAYDKQYLEGRYGADPFLQNMLSECDWQ